MRVDRARKTSYRSGEASVDLEGEYRFSAPREQVWAMLQDPEVLRAAIPGCEELTEVGPDSYDMTVKLGIAAIRGTYQGNVTMSEPKPMESYRLKASGSGKGGSVDGDATISLAEDGDGTLLTYAADVKARGAVARVGGRLVRSAAKMMAGRFFDAVSEQIVKAES
jgi:carbon monoxide dehydrogenase subunit G